MLAVKFVLRALFVIALIASPLAYAPTASVAAQVMLANRRQQSDHHDESLLGDYWDEDELARQLDVTPRTIWRWRKLRTGPPVTIVGRRPMYRKESVLAWLRSREMSMPRDRRRTQRTTPAGVTA